MSSQFVTAKRGSPEFDRLITGRFSRSERALPVQSLRVGKKDEEVTFEIVPLEKTLKLSSKEVLKSFLQLKKILFVLFPLFYFVMRDWNRPFLSSAEILFILAGIILTLLAVQMKVDSEDFISGYDRIRGSRGQKVLSQGARSVSELERYIRISLIASVICGLIPLIVEPYRILGFAAGAVLLFIGNKWGVNRKNRFIRDVCLALIAGPCLAFGIFPETTSLGFGLIWSFFVFFDLQIEHFHHYFAQTEAGEKNLMTLKSFDQAPKILWTVWAISLILYVVYRSLQSQMAVWIGAVLILAYLSLQWRRQLFKLSTPAGSEIDRVAEKGHHLYLTFITLWVAEVLFRSLVAPLVFAWFK